MKHFCLFCFFLACTAVPLHAHLCIRQPGGWRYIPPPPDCDTILTADGRTLLVHIKEVTKTQVFYSGCGGGNSGLDYVLPRNGVKEIRLSKKSLEQSIYKAWVYTKTSSRPLKGYILSTTDSSLILVRNAKSRLGTGKGMQEIPIRDVIKIQFRKKGRVWRSTLFGFAIGAGPGFLGGLASGDDPPGFLSLTARDKAILGGILLGVFGTIIGLVVGLIRKLIRIDGSLDKYRAARASIKTYTLTKR